MGAWSPFKKEVEAVEAIPEEIESGPLETKNFIAAGVWIGLVTFSSLLAPGTIGAPSDNEMINALVSQPVPRPTQINEIWFAIWNCFTIVQQFWRHSRRLRERTNGFLPRHFCGAPHFLAILPLGRISRRGLRERMRRLGKMNSVGPRRRYLKTGRLESCSLP